eukprot:3079092-Prymnesium_polylepis.1
MKSERPGSAEQVRPARVLSPRRSIVRSSLVVQDSSSDGPPAPRVYSSPGGSASTAPRDSRAAASPGGVSRS